MTVPVRIQILVSLFAWVVVSKHINDGICHQMYIRNYPSSLQQLVGCKVIEGSLQISLIQPDSNEQWGNYRYPELREITGHLLVFMVDTLQSLRSLFPNLAVIRGNELINNCSLVISRTELEEVGLVSLTDIQRGNILIWDNPLLCNVNTIDWSIITSKNSTRIITENKPFDQCPQQNSLQMIQRLNKNDSCTSGISTTSCSCCHSECLGGCTGTSASDCFVCKHVVYDGTCIEECPHGLYEFAGRRCVNRMECLETSAYPDLYKGSNLQMWGKLYEKNGKKSCLLECPENTQLSRDKICTECQGYCQKCCPGKIVDSVESARALAGCTRIKGSLEISMQRTNSVNSSALIKELNENLDKIKEIDDYLVITHTVSIFSWQFLNGLEYIHGRNLERGKYSLIVMSNEDLMELWENKRVQIGNIKSNVLFHLNHKLCASKIQAFLNQSGIQQSTNAIGITNGDKRTCDVQVLKVEIEEKTNTSVSFRYENIRRNLSVKRRLLEYEIYYKEAVNYPNQVSSKYDHRDPRYDWEIVVDRKLTYFSTNQIDSDNNSEDTTEDNLLGVLRELPWEPSRRLVNLTANTWYAMYVKAVIIPEDHSFHANTGVESEIIYFQTLPGRPPPPRDFKVEAISPNEISLSWTPPPVRGKLENFKIYLKEVPDWNILDEYRDYCAESNIWSKSSTAQIGGILKTKPAVAENRFDKTAALSEIINHVFIPNPDSDTPTSTIRKIGKKRQKRSLFPFTTTDPASMTLVDIVMVQNGRSRYTGKLNNLLHFTNYAVGIECCGQIESDEWTPVNYLRPNCSMLAVKYVTTLAKPSADYITLYRNVTDENKLQINWTEPENPNEKVLALLVHIQEGTLRDGGYENKTCVSGKNFHTWKNFTSGELPPGNYSLRFQLVTSSMTSNWTNVWFVIRTKNDTILGIWTLFWISLAFVILVSIYGSFRFFNYKRKMAEEEALRKKRTMSANPSYISPVFAKWEIPDGKLEILKDTELGTGSFGIVYEGVLNKFVKGQRSVRCAVKTVSAGSYEADHEKFLEEAELMIKLECRCHHVVKLLGVVTQTTPNYVVMELMTRGNLENYLKSCRSGNKFGNSKPDLSRVVRMAAEVADGMAYIHMKKLIHRDLAARNIVVGEDLSVKVADFGLSKEMLFSDYYRKQSGVKVPVRWMAPESLRDGVFTTETDVWSFGVLLWEIVTLGATPFEDKTPLATMTYISSGNTLEIPPDCAPLLRDIMLHCWRNSPKRRPSFIDILERELTKDVDPSFAQVSFFHSGEGAAYRTELERLQLQRSKAGIMETKFGIGTRVVLEECQEETSDEESVCPGVKDPSTHQLLPNFKEPSTSNGGV